MEIYKKYSDPKTNKISREKFLLLISKLSKNVKEIKGIEMDVVNAIFLIFDKDSDGYIDSEEFIEWWSSSKRFSYFDEDTTKLVKKAYNLFKKYASARSDSTPVRSGSNLAKNKNSIDYNQFVQLLKDLKLDQDEMTNIETFESIDVNDDGYINFFEFIMWLKWF